MRRHIPYGSKECVRDDDVWAMYVDSFGNGCLTVQFAQLVLEQFHREGEEQFGLSWSGAQDGVLDPASPARTSDDVPDAVVEDDIVRAV